MSLVPGRQAQVFFQNSGNTPAILNGYLFLRAQLTLNWPPAVPVPTIENLGQASFGSIPLNGMGDYGELYIIDGGSGSTVDFTTAPNVQVNTPTENLGNSATFTVGSLSYIHLIYFVVPNNLSAGKPKQDLIIIYILDSANATFA